MKRKQKQTKTKTKSTRHSPFFPPFFCRNDVRRSTFRFVILIELNDVFEIASTTKFVVIIAKFTFIVEINDDKRSIVDHHHSDAIANEFKFRFSIVKWRRNDEFTTKYSSTVFKFYSFYNESSVIGFRSIFSFDNKENFDLFNVKTNDQSFSSNDDQSQ